MRPPTIHHPPIGTVVTAVLAALWIAMVALNAPLGTYAHDAHVNLDRELGVTGATHLGFAAIAFAVVTLTLYFTHIPHRDAVITAALPLWWSFSAVTLLVGGLPLAGGLCGAAAIGTIVSYAAGRAQPRRP